MILTKTLIPVLIVPINIISCGGYVILLYSIIGIVLRVVCCVLCVACCVLRVACCVLRVACCVLCFPCCVLYITYGNGVVLYIYKVLVNTCYQTYPHQQVLQT